MVYFALIPRVAGTVDEQYATTKSWTKGLQMLWATQLVDDEVNNGGFNQYFFNRSGQWAMEAIEGFRLIGVVERAEIVKAAVDQFFASRRQRQSHRRCIRASLGRNLLHAAPIHVRHAKDFGGL